MNMGACFRRSQATSSVQFKQFRVESQLTEINGSNKTFFFFLVRAICTEGYASACNILSLRIMAVLEKL